MKYFWGYVIGIIGVLLLSTYIVTISRVEEMFAALSLPDDTFESTPTPTSSIPTSTKKPLFPDNAFVDYHMSEDQIRVLNNHKMKVMHVIGEDGKPKETVEETTKSFPVYYMPGSFIYGPRPYVPTYEDTVKLSALKPFIDVDRSDELNAI